MSNVKPIESGEDRLISHYFKPIATHPGAFGLIDDAAIIEPPAGCDLVLTAAGVVGKGARPIGFLLTLALPKEIGDAWLAPFARGLGADAELFSCPLLGGDTDRTTGPITISIAAFGAVPHGEMLRRAGAKAGDRVVVTGSIGDAALGLLLRRDASAAQRWDLD